MDEINFAIAATKVNALYDATGVDLIHTGDDNDGQPGVWTPIEWIGDAQVDDNTGEGLDRADQILRERGFYRTGRWEDVNEEYYAAPVEKEPR